MVATTDTELLDPAHLSRIEDFSLLAKVVVDGAMPGIHRSLRQGRGTEFFQYRPYDPGEDLKVVDWNIAIILCTERVFTGAAEADAI